MRPNAGIGTEAERSPGIGAIGLRYQGSVIDGNLVSGRTYHDNGCVVGPWIKLLEQAPEEAASSR